MNTRNIQIHPNFNIRPEITDFITQRLLKMFKPKCSFIYISHSIPNLTIKKTSLSKNVKLLVNNEIINENSIIALNTLS